MTEPAVHCCAHVPGEAKEHREIMCGERHCTLEGAHRQRSEGGQKWCHEDLEGALCTQEQLVGSTLPWDSFASSVWSSTEKRGSFPATAE